MTETPDTRDALMVTQADALRRCRDQFEFYVSSHMAKSPPDMDKAATNQEFVELCDAALSTAPSNPPTPEGAWRSLEEAKLLLSELLDGPSKGEFYGIDGALWSKLETIRLTLQRAPSSPASVAGSGDIERIAQEMWKSEDEPGTLDESGRRGEFERLAHAAIRASRLAAPASDGVLRDIKSEIPHVAKSEIPSEAQLFNELALLYNYVEDSNAPQFTRWQMATAIYHGMRLSAAPKAPTAPICNPGDEVARLREALLQTQAMLEGIVRTNSTCMSNVHERITANRQALFDGASA